MSELMRGISALLGIDELERPLWLLAGLIAIVGRLLWSARLPAPSIPWPAYPEAAAAGARRFDPVAVSASVLRSGALCALALVLAGPVAVHRAPPEPGFGLDLLLAVDASGSMRALDTQLDGEWRTRLDLARAVVSRFAKQRVTEGDRVGLVVFGETAFTQCPLTSDAVVLSAALGRVEAGVAGEATALGDGLALAVKRVLVAADDTSVAGRVVVLLTDGRDNAGTISVDVATALAAAEGIRVHTVGIGSSDAEVAMARRPGAAARGLQFERHQVDARTLERVARETGGRFFPVRHSDDLADVYAEIDALERLPRPLPARIHHSPRPEPALAAAGALLLLEVAVARVARRRLP